ncbi:uncharacterized protein LOC132458990 [Gadus macrocephalus]|uniref:uncharacterized protein LOC132458990 n=1 Tax=Gadus macrocephalus TaxID=80720 RepID=UPI0028CB4A17|nr:uncharacterized protein LOC132458990 [Gadus macrocephalus]
MPSDLKTLGAVEMVLGLVDLSLGGGLIKVPTFFKKELFVVFIAGGLTLFTGFTLVWGGRRPSYCCVRYNVSTNLATVLICAVAFGTLVRHVPYRQHKYCKDYYCGSLDGHSVALINSLMAVLVACFLMQTLVSLAVVLIGLYFMLGDGPQDLEAPPCGTSTTAEPLFLMGDPSYAEPIRVSGPFSEPYPEPIRITGPFNQDCPEPIRFPGPVNQNYQEPFRMSAP